MTKEIKAMVIGAGGFVGQNLVIGMEAAGYNVCCVTRSQGKLGQRETLGMNLLNPPEIHKIIRQESPDVVIHCAGLISLKACENDPKLAHDLNASSVGELADACNSARVGLLLHTSTDHVFSGNNNDKPSTETDVPVPSNEYGISKLAGEKILSNSSMKHQIVRTSMVVGDMPFLSHRFTFQRSLLERLRAGKPFDAMNDVISSPTNVRDVVGGIIYLIANVSNAPENSIFHLAGPRSMSKFALAQVLASNHGLNPELVVATSRMEIDPSYPTNVSIDSSKLTRLGYAAKDVSAIL